MVDWSIVLGVATGMALPGMLGLFFLVRMESRVTSIEKDREYDEQWKAATTAKLDGIGRDVNRLIGGAHMGIQ